MDRILLFLSLIFLQASCYQQERNCLLFHTGTFESETYLNGELAKTQSIRNDSMEIDYFQGKVDTSMIRWINPCEYIGTKLHPTRMADKKPLHIKILFTDKDTYTFEYGYVNSTNKKRATAKKIN